MDPELKCFEVLQELALPLNAGESCIDAVLRHLRAREVFFRPYRYPAPEGLHPCFTAYWQNWDRRQDHTQPGGYIDADIFNAFQAGYVAGKERAE